MHTQRAAFFSFWDTLIAILNAIIFVYVGASATNFTIRCAIQKGELGGACRIQDASCLRPNPAAYASSLVFSAGLFSWCFQLVFPRLACRAGDYLYRPNADGDVTSTELFKQVFSILPAVFFFRSVAPRTNIYLPQLLPFKYGTQPLRIKLVLRIKKRVLFFLFCSPWLVPAHLASRHLQVMTA